MSTVRDLPKFGQRVRHRREQLKMTPSDVAAKAGIALATICNLEAGEYLPSLPVYKSLCRALRTSPGKLILPHR